MNDDLRVVGQAEILYDRLPLPTAAAAELRARYLARQRAEERLVDYLAGLAGGLGVTERVAGFDDETDELLLHPAPQEADA